MADEKNKGEGSGCGASGCSSCCKKFVIGVLIGVILTAAAFGIAMGTKCAVMGGGKICPFTQMQTQK